ncbi:polysaccharide deacetylase family protein [Luteolibacter sp. Populi]|uniref:polysaccharide deacetylase family protein n=1 Tax=Luteolibacter sp. Populi TaxID=3230487 RepID=UPI003467E814
MSWPRTPEARPDNRAVTPVFRLLGHRRSQPLGDATLMSESQGLHRGEWRFLSCFVPLVLGALLFDLLWRLGGPWLAGLGILPALFALLHLMTFALGGKNPGIQWGRWEFALVLWSLWLLFLSGGSGSTWAAILWLSFFLLNFLCTAALTWKVLMSMPPFLKTRFRFFLTLVLHLPALILAARFGWPGFFAGLTPIALIWCSGTLCPTARFFGPMVTRVAGKGPLITIDDGPDPADTPAILDLLDAYNVKAVFFVIGEKVKAHPELAREILRRGHELANHTMTHPAGSFWAAGAVRTRREIAGCSRIIEEVTGQKPRWFRAPVGHRNWFTHPVCHELGMEVIAWNRRAFDTVRSDVPGIVHCLTHSVQDGDILLLHESTPAAKQVVAGTLAALAPK